MSLLNDALNRRDVLKVAGLGGLGALTCSLPRTYAAPTTNIPATADACILINMVGGPSQLDTFDPKPDAPREIRSPFGTISTRIPGIRFSELFPRLAGMNDQFSLIRSMNHAEAPIHEVGLQMLNSGRLFRDGVEWPSLGARVAQHLGERNGCPAWWVMPGQEIQTGLSVSHGQGWGHLTGFEVRPSLRDSSLVELASCAVQAIKSGARFVTLNTFSTVFDTPSWDCHTDRGSLSTSLDDYRKTVAPQFDQAFATLLTELRDQGLLGRTLVVATGEFGRTPRLNARGGRDHWAGCWSALVAGGGIQGGRVLGRSDAHAAEPIDRPVHPTELAATIVAALGLSPDMLTTGPDQTPARLVDAAPVRELF